MKSKEEIAIEKFRSGLNCAQSVVVAFVNYFGYDAKHAMDLSIGFGGGIGRLQKTCGAISGAVMVCWACTTVIKLPTCRFAKNKLT